MKPYDHAELSVKKFGGKYTDYIEIHKWFDQFRYAVGDIRHRLFLHNTVGVMICEQVFGDYLENSNGKKIAVRDIAEHHIFMDVGEIRTPQDWLNNFNDLDYMKPFPAKLDDILDTGKILKKEIDLTKIKPFEEIKPDSQPFEPYTSPKKRDPFPYDNHPKIFD